MAVSNIAEQDQKISDRLQRENIVVFNGKTEHTTYFVNHINSEGRRQRLPQKARPISADQIANVLKHVTFIHLGPLHPSDIGMPAVKLLNEFDLRVILDVQGYVRSVRNQIVYPTVSQKLSDALMAAHIIKANKVEYDAILDFYQVDLIELMTRFKLEEFIVTLREKGGFVQRQSGDKIYYDADRPMSIEDPTGAGDVFLASYIIGRFLKQKNIAEACTDAARLVTRQIAGNYIKKNTLMLAHENTSD
jgi:sugar/nucleoside kinase (ribokinase family)